MFRSRKILSSLKTNLLQFHTSSKLLATPRDAKGNRVFTEEEFKNNFLRGWVDAGGKQSDAEQHIDAKHLYTEADLLKALDDEMSKTSIYINKESAYQIFEIGYKVGEKSAQQKIQEQHSQIIAAEMEKSKQAGRTAGISANLNHAELSSRLKTEAKKEAAQEAQPEVQRIRQEMQSLQNPPLTSDADEIKKIKHETRLFQFPKNTFRLMDLPLSYRIYSIEKWPDARIDRIRIKDWKSNYRDFHIGNCERVSSSYTSSFLTLLTVTFTVGIPLYLTYKYSKGAKAGETFSQKKSRQVTEKNCASLNSLAPSDYALTSFTNDEMNSIQQCKKDCDAAKDFHQQMQYEMLLRRATTEGNPKYYGLRDVPNIYKDENISYPRWFSSKKKDAIQANALLVERINNLKNEMSMRSKKQAYDEMSTQMGLKRK